MRLRLGLHPEPAGELNYSAPLDPLASFKKADSRREGEGERECRDGKGGEGG